MIATKTLPLMVMGLVGRENGGKAKNCRVLCRILARVLARSPGLSPGSSPGSVYRHPHRNPLQVFLANGPIQFKIQIYNR